MAEAESVEGKTVSTLVQSSFGVVVGKADRRESHKDNGTPSSRLHFNSKSTAGSASSDKLGHQISEEEFRSLGPISPKEGRQPPDAEE